MKTNAVLVEKLASAKRYITTDDDTCAAYQMKSVRVSHKMASVAALILARPPRTNEDGHLGEKWMRLGLVVWLTVAD